jgi:hypothetical protein
MSKTLTTVVHCDYDAEEIPDGEHVTRRVTVGGRQYETDLCALHAKGLDELLARLRRPSRGSARRDRSPGARQHLAEARAWARANGLEVGDRGRMPKAVMTRYEARNRKGGQR